MEKQNLPAPVLAATGLSLVVGGSIAFVATGMHVLSIAGAAAGAVILIASRLLRKKPAPKPISGEAALKELKRYVSKAKYLENVGDQGEKTARQLTEVSDRFENFQAVLNKKFNPSELTFGRYLSAAEQTYLSILDSLNEIALSLNTLSTIDPSQLDGQAERKALREKEVKRVDDALSMNEQAFTELDRISMALSQVVTRKGESDTDIDAAIVQLKELAERAKKYSVTTKKTTGE